MLSINFMQTHIIAHGGGMRAAFAAGVLYELAKQGVTSADFVTAVSASTPTAAYFVASQFEYIKQIWCEDLVDEEIISLRRLYSGEPVVDTSKLIHKIFQEKRPLAWGRILESSTELQLTAYDFVLDRLEYFSNKDNFNNLDKWDLLQACMTIHNAHLQGDIAHLVDSNLIPFGIYSRPWETGRRYIVIDNFPFWDFGTRQYLGTLFFRVFQGRNFPEQVKGKLKQRKDLYIEGMAKFQYFMKVCQPIVIKYPKHAGARPMSTIARSKDRLSFLFELGRGEVVKVVEQNIEALKPFQDRAKELV